ncbi:hypothetical protein BJY04DRAFT_143231 [Aspergillus karnatakaensis]|uniref:uncharacterized protein n=1 Tax=Aspergillus karnatakaensis TaxID=1810916 RepID=UPI003CCD2BB3
MTEGTLPKPSALLALPTELLVEIFQAAPTLETAANLSATSQELHQVWQQYRTPIYNSIVINTIPCYADLRELLSIIEDIPADKQSLTVEEMARVIEVSKAADSMADDHTNNDQEYQDPQVVQDLSPSERRRFVRAQYQLIGLLCLDPDAQGKRIESLDLKTLFLLSDFLCVFYWNEHPDDRIHNLLLEAKVPPPNLQRNLRMQRNKVFKDLYGRHYRPRHDTPYEQNGRYAWWCDKQQDLLKSLLTGQIYCTGNGDEAKLAKEKVREDMWYDSEEE